jgi:RNA polymerase sigma-70 factor (ECF subfamily)
MNSDLSSATSDSTSSSLLGRLRRRDPDAWSRLTTIYGPLVYRWARHSRLHEDDAADVVQEVFQVVATRIDTFDEQRSDASFRGWLWGITRNKLHEQLRDQQANPQATGGSAAQQQFGQLPDPPPAEDDESSSADVTTRLVRRALRVIQADFSERSWQAFSQATLDGHAAADIAADLNMSVAAVYKAKSRVLARLREVMSGLD